ncbi:hypothetical protein EYZ11_000202 [Aspergillus tanneri]|uniref:Uncharacterized protein n=1 Tax=Aspergillus tanneri TaxID=1220188 RepID=A0A4S3JXP4_9EURO|nr:hypothetical protein EYZ11_000202 [Aspergillus tanneri]
MADVIHWFLRVTEKIFVRLPVSKAEEGKIVTG